MKGHCPHLKKMVLLTKQHLCLQIMLALFPLRPLDLQNEQGVTRHYEALPGSRSALWQLVQSQLPNREGFTKAYHAPSSHLMF